jgi:type IV pilus assembly protein PilF
VQYSSQQADKEDTMTMINFKAKLISLVGVSIVLALAGCAGAGGGSGGQPQTDQVTSSDEPEARKRARVRLELASGYFTEGKTTVALDEIKLALIADPNFGEAFNLRGLIYMRLSDMRLAEDSFRRALALNPKDADAAHNFGWMLCQQRRYDESFAMFNQANAVALYNNQSKTYMTRGLCELAANRRSDAERSFTRSYELDAGNPISGYHLSLLLFDRGEMERAQFYVRRLNNSQLANSETLWLGIKIERKMGNNDVVSQLSTQLRRRYPQSKELASLERGAFDE